MEKSRFKELVRAENLLVLLLFLSLIFHKNISAQTGIELDPAIPARLLNLESDGTATIAVTASTGDEIVICLSPESNAASYEVQIGEEVIDLNTYLSPRQCQVLTELSDEVTITNTNSEPGELAIAYVPEGLVPQTETDQTYDLNETAGLATFEISGDNESVISPTATLYVPTESAGFCLVYVISDNSVGEYYGGIKVSPRRPRGDHLNVGTTLPPQPSARVIEVVGGQHLVIEKYGDDQLVAEVGVFCPETPAEG